MPTYKTPNVYIEEIPTLPPSVVPVATAVPAFIGHTEKAGEDGEYLNQPVRITSLLDYTTHFGGAQPASFTVTLDAKQQITQIIRGTSASDEASETEASTKESDSDPSAIPNYLLYYALRLFFDNGGGACYVVSVGDYGTLLNKTAFETGLEAIQKEDEPTLIVLADAINLASTDYYTLCQKALAQCALLKDRFAIFDVLASDHNTNGIGAKFREHIGTSDLKYGAAYYPYLLTALSYHYTDESVGLTLSSETDTQTSDPIGEFRTGGDNGLLVTYRGPASDNPKVVITLGPANRVNIAVVEENDGLVIKLPPVPPVPPEGSTEPPEVSTASDIVNAFSETENYQLAIIGDGSATIEAQAETALTYPTLSEPSQPGTLADLKTTHTELYNAIKATLGSMRVVMPPSSAVAGAYASVDRERGVWKAPANVSLASVIGPMVKISNAQQDNLNVDATSGKSINAIRSFTGKGTLIWGARTLAGNDNEWRYIPVRRLFNLIEESIQKATSFVVFESNNAVTWLKVKTLVETYLDGLWRQGALAGATQKQAYFVSVGLGQTMTPQDILEGRMIIEIGIAAVRPAEFIILRFSHKLQEA
jgi:phage tail sheath protein FI